MSKRKRRTEEELIADLQDEIKRLKQRAAEKKAKTSPDGKAFLTAVKALDRAIEAMSDADLLRALEAARAPLSQEMVKQGLRLPNEGGGVIYPMGSSKKGKGKRIRRSAEELAQLRCLVLEYVQNNPGVKLGQIAAALGVETKDARRPTFDLIEAGDLRSEGERGGTRYFVG